LFLSSFVFPLLFRHCFIPISLTHVVSSLAYPNLLGTKRLGCYCCCWQHWNKSIIYNLLQKIDTWFVSCVLTVVSSIRNTFGESINFDTCTREVGAKDCINNGCFSQFSDKYWPLYPYLSKVSTNLSSNFFPPAHFTCQENKVLTEHHKLKSWPSITTTKKWDLSKPRSITFGENESATALLSQGMDRKREMCKRCSSKTNKSEHNRNSITIPWSVTQKKLFCEGVCTPYMPDIAIAFQGLNSHLSICFLEKT
jgi:hypothetical protein